MSPSDLQIADNMVVNLTYRLAIPEEQIAEAKEGLAHKSLSNSCKGISKLCQG